MNMEEMTVMKRKKQNMEKALSGRVLGVVSALDLAAIVVPLCVGPFSVTDKPMRRYLI